MLAYARSDTHFLLFIYDNLRNALLDRASSHLQPHALEIPQPQTNINSSSFDPRHSLLREVLSRSEETSLRLHQTENYDEEGAGPGGWDTIARKWNKVAFTKAAHRSTQKSIYSRIHGWRDRVAREEDESTAYAFHDGLSSISFTHVGCRYVLPQHYLFQLAEQSPNDLPELLSIFRAVPPVIKRRASELLGEIRAGGSGSVDISGSRRTVADLAEKSDINPVRNVDQDEVHSRSGIVSIGLVYFETLLTRINQYPLTNLLSRHTHSSACAKRYTRRRTAFY
jgi:exosome complex exonuclease RRP6